MASAFSGVGCRLGAGCRLGDLFAGIAGSSGSSFDDEQQLKKAKIRYETLPFFSGFAASDSSGLVGVLRFSMLAESAFCRRDLLLLPLLRSLRPFRMLLLEPRSVFSESFFVVSWALSSVDCLSTLEELRDAAGASKCFFDPSAALEVSGFSGG